MSKSFLDLFRSVNGSPYGNNLAPCRSLSWTLCSWPGYDDRTLILGNVVCPPNSLSKFQFNSLFFLYNLHKYCITLIKELNCHDPFKRKNLFVNLWFPLTWNFYWGCMVLFMISFLHRCANTYRNILYPVCQGSVMFQKWNVRRKMIFCLSMVGANVFIWV